MKSFKIFLLALIVAQPAWAQTTTVVVNPNVKHQTMKGWGGSLCWWANMAGGFSESKVNEICTWITSPDELNMNVFRFNIGGGDNPSHNHLRTDGGNMPGYKASAAAPYDWSKDANQRKILLKLNSLRDDVINEGFSNSPPYWMTKSGCASGNTDGSDNLRDDQYAAFADYLTEVTKHYKETYGITFHTLTPFNEPFSTWWKAMGGQEGCRFGQDNQHKMILELHKSLTEKNMLNYCTISAMDANSIDETVNGINGYAAAGNILSKITQINTHSYFGSRRAELLELSSRHGKELWQSETGPLSVSASGLANHLLVAQRIITDLKQMKPVVWLDWQLMTDRDPHWGLIPADYNNQTYYKAKSYYVRMQCSRFIKQGYTIIETNQPNVIAALDPSGTEVVVVVCNEGASTQNLNIDLSAFASAGAPVVYRTSSSENCVRSAGIAISGKSLNYASPAASVTTFVIPVTPASVVPGAFQIIARHSLKALEAHSGGEIHQRTNTNTVHQQWLLTEVNGYYKITSRVTGLAMTVSNQSGQDGAAVVTSSFTGNDSQLWTLRDLGNGYYELINKNSAKVADIPGVSAEDGVRLTQYSPNNGFNQQFLLSPVTLENTRDCNFEAGGTATLDECGVCTGGTTGLKPCKELPEGDYALEPVHSGLCIEDATSVSQQNCLYKASQMWSVRKSGNYYQIQNIATGKYLSYIPAASSYVLSTFKGDTDPGMKLSIYTSNDALNFNLLSDTGFEGTSSNLRDPSIMRYTDGKYYVAYTNAPTESCCGPENYFSIASSTDLINWTNIATVPSGIPNTAHTWAPEWYIEGNTIRIIASVDTGDWQFRAYIYTALNNTLTAWSAPVYMGIGPNYIDTYVIKKGSTYHAFTKNETTKYLEHATSASLTGPWTFIATGNWSGWGSGVEGNSIVTLGNGSYRIFFDSQGTPFKYATSQDLMTWSGAANVPAIFNIARHGTVINLALQPPLSGTQVNTSASGDNTWWRLEDAGNGSYTLVPSTNFGLAADVNNASALPGSGLILYQRNSGDNQKFKFTKDITTAVDVRAEISGEVYPNPAKDVLQIETDLDLSKATIRFADVMGEEIMVPVTVNGKTASADVSSLTGGTYVLQIKLENQSVRKKVIIMR